MGEKIMLIVLQIALGVLIGKIAYDMYTDIMITITENNKEDNE